MRQNILFSYAYLKVNFDKANASPVDLMLPFSMRALATIEGRVVSAPELQRAIANIWGLNIPQNVCRFMFPKLADQGYLTREDNLYTINKRPGSKKSLRKSKLRRGKFMTGYGRELKDY